ncbi:MAG TPA: C1 family peptidase [Flavisolibacter sp.]|nr:C1 family peptidase [Flavisolibacter sp.]
MKKCFLLLATVINAATLCAQGTSQKSPFYEVKTVKATPVKNQAMTGTCWCFSTTSLVESEAIRKTSKEVDISEMFTVRNIYIEKAKNYILRTGKAQFGEGGLGHDMIRAMELYGAMPESAYSGLVNGARQLNHGEMAKKLETYLGDLLKKVPVAENWLKGYEAILDEYMGAPPAQFSYEGKTYTPQAFAKEVVKFSAEDYVNITSFTHAPYYKPFVLQVPDNFSNGSFYNLPLDEMIAVVKESVNKGYSVMWDADVSNNGFKQDIGLALYLDQQTKYAKENLHPETQEQPYNVTIRQQLYENLTTQDDHLMHIVGTEKSKDGKTFFLVKNSWGSVGPYNGYINVSEPYFAINTVTLVVPKAALSKELLAKLKP